jgi:hypothetical protein
MSDSLQGHSRYALGPEWLGVPQRNYQNGL